MFVHLPIPSHWVEKTTLVHSVPNRRPIGAYSWCHPAIAASRRRNRRATALCVPQHAKKRKVDCRGSARQHGRSAIDFLADRSPTDPATPEEEQARRTQIGGKAF